MRLPNLTANKPIAQSWDRAAEQLTGLCIAYVMVMRDVRRFVTDNYVTGANADSAEFVVDAAALPAHPRRPPAGLVTTTYFSPSPSSLRTNLVTGPATPLRIGVPKVLTTALTADGTSATSPFTSLAIMVSSALSPLATSFFRSSNFGRGSKSAVSGLHPKSPEPR
jgi:hypothetical protein